MYNTYPPPIHNILTKSQLKSKPRFSLTKLIFTLFFVSTNIAFAENSGGFIGLGIGGGAIKAGAKINDVDSKSEIWAMQNTLDWGAMAGYKHFFTQKFGARFYANVIIAHASMIGMQYNGTNATLSTFLLNYTANADLLYDFYNNSNIEAGAFIGLGLGGSSYYVVGAGVFGAQHGFDIGINFGLRTQFSHNHGIELFARVPFLPFAKAPSRDIDIDVEASVGQAFSLMMRYVYTYGNTPKKVQTSTQARIKKTRKIKRKVID